MAHWCLSFDSIQDPAGTHGAAGAEAQPATAAAETARGGPAGGDPLVLMTTVRQEGEPSQESSFEWESGMELKAEAGHQDPGQQRPEELIHEAAAAAVAQPLPGLTYIQNRFLPWQLEELERAFQETHYPEALTISLLAGLLEVTEARVKSWFNNRRVKYRKSARKMSLGAAPPGFQHHDLVACWKPTAMPPFLSHLFGDGGFPEPQTPGPPELPIPPAYP